MVRHFAPINDQKSVENHDEDTQELYLRWTTHRSKYYVFPQQPYYSWASVEDIKKLPNPHITAREHYYFQ